MSNSLQVHLHVVTKKTVIIFCILSLLLVALGFVWTGRAAAGSNGQQLTVNAGCLWNSVTVTGRNHAGTIATWRRTNTSLVPCYPSTVSTNGWWWVGNVTITVRGGVSGNRVKVCYANVPKTQPSDWHSVSCRMDY